MKRTHKSALKTGWMITLFLAITSAANAQFLDFSQASINFDGNIANHSDWGSVNLTFNGQSSLQYFNLSINGAWQIQNVPVLSSDGFAVPQSLDFWYSLGVPSGTPVSSLNYSYSLTTSVIAAPPSGSAFAPVSDRTVTFFSGLRDGLAPPVPAAEGMVGGVVSDAQQHIRYRKFPNQEAGPNECAPAAISNSLMFLGLGDDASIAKMKTATKWDVGHGVWKFHDNTRPAGQQNAWYEDKDAYMKANKIPVTTKVVKNFDDVKSSIDEGCDVELQVSWMSGGGHTVAVEGISKLDDGRYVLQIAHDMDQLHKGGLVKTPLIYNPATNGFDGSAYFKTGKFDYFVVESAVPEPGAVAMVCALTATSVIILWRRRTRRRLRKAS